MLRLCILISALCSTSGLAGEPLRVMSFNLRFGSANDGENRWDLRKSILTDTIEAFGPDILGTQETLQFQADYVSQTIAGYTYFGRSRMKTPNEHCGIFYRTARFTQLAGGHFWLSETPEIPESKSWDSSLPRMASWVLLSDKKDAARAPVLFVNTHFDHRGAVARTKSAELIRKRISRLKQLAENPIVILTGDFNTDENSEPYRALLENNPDLVDTYRAVHAEENEEEGTFNSWNGTSNGARIDWILADSRLSVRASQILRSEQNGRYPSDHYPVTATLAH